MSRPAFLFCCHRVSEIRAVNLLEDLCDAMEDYTLVTPSSSNDAANSTEQQQEQQQAAWVKYKGEGRVKVDRAQRCAGAGACAVHVAGSEDKGLKYAVMCLRRSTHRLCGAGAVEQRRGQGGTPQWQKHMHTRVSSSRTTVGCCS